jgi:lipopolysaccharide assembly outer membrane protein LptD (OstA)
VISSSTSYFLPPPLEKPAFYFTAEHFEDWSDSRTQIFQGRAQVWNDSWTVTSESLSLDLDAALLRSTGPFVLQNQDGAVSGASCIINAETGEGEMSDGRMRQAPWFFHGERVVSARGRYHFARSIFTSCENEPPDYRVTATSLDIYPEHWIKSWNNVLYIGRWPLFYAPYWYHSLAPDSSRWKTSASFADDKRNGWTARTDTDFRITPHLYDRVMIDGYQREGVGLGDELDYNSPNRYRGTLRVYDIEELSTGLDRWSVTGDNWQKLPGLYSAQWRLQAMSDPQFNNDYSRADNTPVAAYVINSGALVRQSTMTTTRLSFSRQDNQNPADPQGFVKSTEDYPRLDFNTASLKLFRLPGLGQVTAFADRNYTAGQGFIQDSGGGTWSQNGMIKLTRDLTFNPAGSISENYQEHNTGNPGPERNVAVGRFLLTPDLRDRTILGDLDLKYGYTRRLAVNSLRPDADAADRGVEQDMINLQDFYRPSRKASLNISSGYDLRRATSTNQLGGGFKDRLQPINAVLNVRPSSDFSVAVTEIYRYGFGPSAQQSVIAQADYGGPGETHLGAGFSKNSASRQYQLSQTLGFWPKKLSWSLEGDVNYLAGGGPAKLLKFDLRLKKSWHDFEGTAGVVARPGAEREYQASLNFKFREAAAAPIRHPDWEQEWYPWRPGLQDR